MDQETLDQEFEDYVLAPGEQSISGDGEEENPLEASRKMYGKSVRGS